MKLVTWNCNMAFRKKKERILHYSPDILVIQECEDPARKGQWTEFTSWVWFGDNRHKGLGVFARNGFHVKVMDQVSCHVGRYIVPVKITGTAEIVLFAVWAMDDKNDSKKRYIGQVYTAIEAYKNLIGAKSIVVGDFNWNAIWDTTTSRLLYGNFASTVAIMEKRGLCSAYHFFTNSVFGKESDPTLFLLKKRSRPYHIDYIFVPCDWISKLRNFWVGVYDEWIESSDHMPMMVEIDL